MTTEPASRIWINGHAWPTEQLIAHLNARVQDRGTFTPNQHPTDLTVAGGGHVCNHRPLGRWGKIWAIWTGAAFGSFLAIEITGLLTVGSDGTWSEFYRVITGRKEPCRHSRAGMVGTLTLFLWGAVHLVWGVLGWVPPRARR